MSAASSSSLVRGSTRSPAVNAGSARPASSVAFHSACAARSTVAQRLSAFFAPLRAACRPTACYRRRDHRAAGRGRRSPRWPPCAALGHSQGEAPHRRPHHCPQCRRTQAVRGRAVSALAEPVAAQERTGPLLRCGFFDDGDGLAEATGDPDAEARPAQTTLRGATRAVEAQGLSRQEPLLRIGRGALRPSASNRRCVRIRPHRTGGRPARGAAAFARL